MEQKIGVFGNLTPKEIKHLKAQVGAMLNYTRQGSFPEALGDELRMKITKDQIDYIKREIDSIRKGNV